MDRATLWRERIRPVVGLPGLLVVALVVEQCVLVPARTARPQVHELAFWHEYARTHPGFAPGLLRLAQEYRRSGDLKAARRVYGEVLEVAPDSEAAVLSLSNLLSENGEAEAAVAALERFLEGSPDCSLCLHNLAVAHLAQGRPALARLTVDRLLATRDTYVYSRLYRRSYVELDPRAEALGLASRIYEILGEEGEARELLRRGLERSERCARCQMQAARLAREPTEALDHWTRYARLAPADLQGPIHQARLLVDSGRLEEAQQVLARSTARARVAPPVLRRDWIFQNAVLAHRQDRRGDALTQLRALLSQHPGFSPARALLREIESDAG